MRALNGKHRKELLSSLQSTDPQRWKFLQLSDEPHLVWRGETLHEGRAATAPPGGRRAIGSSQRLGDKSEDIDETMQQGSVVSRLTPVPSPSRRPQYHRSLTRRKAQKDYQLTGTNHLSTIVISGPDRAIRTVERPHIVIETPPPIPGKSCSTSEQQPAQADDKTNTQKLPSKFAPPLTFKKGYRSKAEDIQSSRKQLERHRKSSYRLQLAQSLPANALRHLNL